MAVYVTDGCPRCGVGSLRFVWRRGELGEPVPWLVCELCGYDVRGRFTPSEPPSAPS